MNGFMADNVQQRRGLRQGNTLSPVFINFALEPLLLQILNDNSIRGYLVSAQVSQRSIQSVCTQPIKLLAYADDFLVFVRN